MIAANLPDADVLVFLTDIPPVSFRRGWTHGVLAQLAWPFVLTGLMLLVARLRPGKDAPPIRASSLLLLSYIGIYTHVFLDYLNNYGVRLLAPFDWRWFYGDAVFIIDPWLWVTLGAGIWLARRQRAPRAARGALIFATCYIAVMLVSARAAREVVIGAWQRVRGSTPHALMVGPVPVSPFAREVIVDAGDRYERGSFSWWGPTVTFDPVTIPKNEKMREVAAARDEPMVRGFLVWSRFPYWEIDRGPDGTLVSVRDVRFGGPVRARFVASTLVR